MKGREGLLGCISAEWRKGEMVGGDWGKAREVVGQVWVELHIEQKWKNLSKIRERSREYTWESTWVKRKSIRKM